MSVIEVAFITGPAIVVAGAVYIADRLNSTVGRHTITPHHSHAAPRDPFTDPADRDDPDGGAWLERIRSDTPAPSPPLAELVRSLPETGPLPELPPDPPPDATGVLPPAEAWLGMPTERYVDELFAKHAEAVTPLCGPT